MQPVGTELIRQINKSQIMNEIRKHDGVARTDIAEKIGLSPATVTAITAELLEDGLISIAEHGEPTANTRGRPRVFLAINPEAAHVVGVKISLHQISISVTNFAGEVLISRILPVRANRQPSEVIADLIEDGVQRAIQDVGMTLDDISGIGIGVPGFIDHSTGVCYWSPVFGDGPTPFGDQMRARLGRLVLLDNDANLVTLAEQWFGIGKTLDDFLVVTIEHGVGMGLIIDGQLYRGANSFGSEFGHSKVQRGGALCRCGQRGCIEAYVADYALLREAATFLPVADTSDPMVTHRTVELLIEAAAEGNRQAQQIFDRAGEMLGIGIANLINVLNPPAVILSGEGVRAAEYFEAPMRAAVQANIISADQGRTDLRIHSWGDDVWARGAAALVLQHLYRSPLARP